jgi:glycolate oxidase FAD binding subunit
VDALVDKLRTVVGPPHVLTGVELSPFVVEGRTPTAAVFPETVDQVVAVVREAVAAGSSVMPWGGGTAMAVGEPPRPGIVLGLRRLSRVVEHEPGDLTATVEAGLTLASLQETLRARGQWLSLDPPDAERATVGGIVAANAAGARRHLYGTVRDLLIGLTVVTADGAVVRGGGKVVKNVAGYDIPKLFIGSWGTLGIVVEATFKLRPLPDDERLLAVRFERLKDCGVAARGVLASDLIPSALDVVDAAAASALGLASQPALVVGFDGLPEQVEWQTAELSALVGPLGGRDVTTLPPPTWLRLPTIARDAIASPTAMMTFSVLPTLVADTMEQGAQAARQRGLASAWAAHAGVGVIRGALRTGREPTEVAAVLTEWRTIAAAGGGHAALTWAPLAVKSQVPVWDDAGAAGRIMRRVKAQLDPDNVLSPGRFVAGI